LPTNLTGDISRISYICISKDEKLTGPAAFAHFLEISRQADQTDGISRVSYKISKDDKLSGLAAFAHFL
jgi:hypothetical protein